MTVLSSSPNLFFSRAFFGSCHSVLAFLVTVNLFFLKVISSIVSKSLSFQFLTFLIFHLYFLRFINSPTKISELQILLEVKRQAVTKDLTSSSKFSGSFVQTLQPLLQRLLPAAAELSLGLYLISDALIF